MPEIQPELVGHWQGWPEMPGLMAQHQPPGMTQIVPGGVAGCAKDGEAERAPRAKITPTIRPSQLHILHAWEPYQFRDGGCHQYVSPSPFKVTQLVGDYGQLRWGYQHYEPNQNDRDTKVDVERVETQS